ncbi:MAG: hypothetical protein AAGJ94_06325 [Pseudomonadota bacterium]
MIAFEDGHRVKLKADAYVLRHKALTGLAFEKNLLALVAAGGVDDVLPLLAEDVAAAVRAYQTQVLGALGRWEAKLHAFVGENAHLERKEFAAKTKASLPPLLQPIAFRARDGIPPRNGLMGILERAAHSDTRVEAIRPVFEMAWTPVRVDD